MYGVLTDPAFDGGLEPRGDRTQIRMRAVVADMVLTFAAFASYLMWANGDCSHGTSSGIPFSLVAGYRSGRGLHVVPGAYWGAVMLMLVAVAGAFVYPVAVARKPRPHFVHVAGSYLLVNAATLFSTIFTTWAGCGRFESLRAPTAALAFIGHIASFLLLQHCVLVKVEALEERSSSESAVRRCYRMMNNPVTIGFGVLSSVIPLGVFEVGGHAYALILRAQMCFVIFFLVFFVAFTVVATRSMTSSFAKLRNAVMEPVERRVLRRHLGIHAVATVAGNGFTVVYFVTIVGTIRGAWNVHAMFSAYAVDNLLHTLLALTLSGIVGPVCNSKEHVSVLEEEVGGDPREIQEESGVVEKMQLAGHLVQSSNDDFSKVNSGEHTGAKDSEQIVQRNGGKDVTSGESLAMLTEDLEDLTIS